MIAVPETESRMREFYDGTRVAVTGASGFIGRALVRRLADLGARVRGFDRADGIADSKLSAIFCSLDVRSEAIVRDWVKGTDPRVVFHLAAMTEVRDSHSRPTEYLATNVHGTLNLLNACRDAITPVHFVHGSSDKVYGDQLKMCLEEDPLEGNSDMYSFSKKVADELVQLYTKNYRTWSTIVRPGNVYGPGQTNKTTLVTRTIDLLKRGEPPIVYGGSRYSVREWVYVDDVVDAYALLGSGVPNLVQGRASIFNVGSHQRFSVESVVGRLLTIFGRSVFDFTLEADSTPQSESQRIVCHKFMRAFPEWSTVEFEDGLRRTVEWQTRGGAL